MMDTRGIGNWLINVLKLPSEETGDSDYINNEERDYWNSDAADADSQVQY